MRKIAILWALTALVAIFAFPATTSASNTSLPDICAPNWYDGGSYYSQQYIGFVELTDWNGPDEYICLQGYDDFTFNGDVSHATVDVQDGNRFDFDDIKNQADDMWIELWPGTATWSGCVVTFKMWDGWGQSGTQIVSTKVGQNTDLYYRFDAPPVPDNINQSSRIITDCN